MVWLVCVLFLVLSVLIASAIYVVLRMVESTHTRRAISTIPPADRCILLGDIQKRRGNFCVVNDLKQHIRGKRFGKDVKGLLVRAMRSRELVCDGNGPTKLKATRNVPPGFAMVWLSVMKDDNYEISSVGESPLQSSEEDALKEIVKKYFGCSRDNVGVFEEKLSTLKKTLDGLDITIMKNPSGKKVGAGCV